MFGHHHLMSAGAQIEGVVLEWSPAPFVRTKDRLRVGVKFDDGHNVIPISLIEGSTVPVRYDPDDRQELAIDLPALLERAVKHWSDYKAATRTQAEATLAAQAPSSRSTAAHHHHSVSSADAHDVTPELSELADLHRQGELRCDCDRERSLARARARIGGVACGNRRPDGDAAGPTWRQCLELESRTRSASGSPHPRAGAETAGCGACLRVAPHGPATR